MDGPAYSPPLDADLARLVERLSPDDLVFHFDADVVADIIRDAGRPDA